MGKKTITMVLLSFLMLVIAIAPLLIAEEATTTTPPAPADTESAAPANDATLWGLILASGAIGFFIILLSIISLAMIIENAVNLRRDKLIPPDLLQDVEDLFEDENYEEVMETCAAEPGFLTNAIAAALPRLESGYSSMMEAANKAIDEETVKLHQKISWLQLIGAMAPMLGLLGTVQGMIVSFSQIAALPGSPKPKDLATGIYLALVTTVEGLVVAIPAICGYFYFRNKVVRLTMEVVGVNEELMDRFRDKK